MSESKTKAFGPRSKGKTEAEWVSLQMPERMIAANDEHTVASVTLSCL